MVDSAHSEGTSVLDAFGPSTRQWFTDAFAAPTPAQAQAWQAITSGDNALVVAPTGSGKTLAAFLWSVDRLAHSPVPDKNARCRVLYVSPLKALAVDVERNLRSPLTGIARTASALGESVPDLTVAVRSGDSTPTERRRITSAPPDILITTPESLFLLLTSAGREVLASVETVIIDEVHALAGTKRGAHLALSLERLDELCGRDTQRIGLSATVRPAERVATFLGGDRPVRIVAPPAEKSWRLDVVVPLPDMTELAATQTDAEDPGSAPPQRSIWPHVTERVLDLIEAHRSTIVFANSRRTAERLTAQLNELHAERLGFDVDTDHAPPAQVIAQSGSSHPAPPEAPQIARAHHGSVSKEQRARTEDALKSGALRCVVATSSLELGIDMGAVDLVVQVGSPPSVASGLQRVGRAGHQVGAESRGVFFPSHRGDLIESAVVVDRMRAGAIEEIVELTNPLDILAQHLVSMCALDERDVAATYALIRRCASFAHLPMSAYEAVLDMLSGRYPSEEFAELRPRLVWHRESGTLNGRPGAQRLAVTSGGTIPDRGLFGVHLAGEEEGAATGRQRGSRRVGELDEEMVYESRVGDVITLGTTSWRIEDITHDRVLVSPAPGLPGRLPFWKGDQPSRPAELGTALGRFTRELATAGDDGARARLRASGLDDWAIDNLLAHLSDQRASTGVLPSDELIMVERFRDDLGDWQLCVHAPLGLAVLTPWALAIEDRARDQFGTEVHATAANDGIVIRIPDTSDHPPGADLVLIEPEEIGDIVTRAVVGSALFAARFRECAARALLLPRRDPGSRSPLWQQRMRAAQLLQVASQHDDFPIILETMRECLRDVFDLPTLITLQQRLASRHVRLMEVETGQPSPYARSLLFGYVGQFVYEGDAPLAERRSAALSLDTALLAELLGTDQLHQLLDPAVIADVEAELQAVVPDRRRSNTEELFDLLRTAGPYTTDELDERWDAEVPVTTALSELTEAHRVGTIRLAGRSLHVTTEDLPRLRDAFGVPIPPGMVVPDAAEDPLGDLVLRWARTHGPFTAEQVADRYGIGTGPIATVLQQLDRGGQVVAGEFLEGAGSRQFCHTRVLSMIKRRTLAALRAEVEPTDPAALGRFLPQWQGVAAQPPRPTGAAGPAQRSRPATPTLGRGVEAVLAAVEQLSGVAIPVSMLDSFVLPARVGDHRPELLDELITSGDVGWTGAGSLGDHDGWVVLHPHGAEPPPLDPAYGAPTGLAADLLDKLAHGGSWLFDDLVDRPEDRELVTSALWDLVWSGHVTCDTFTPVRARLSGTRTVRRAPRQRSLRVSARRVRMPPRFSSPSTVGRWSAVRRGPISDTERLADTVLGQLDRYGVVTRGSVVTEQTVGGFGAAYKALSRLEESGTCRRGYFVAGLGAAQFALPGAVDLLRQVTEPGADPIVHVLAACDPANPYGAALSWPSREGHRPTRSAGALVVLVDGELACYLERGGRSLLTFADPLPSVALEALADVLSSGRLGTITLERIDGADVLSDPRRTALEAAGFSLVPQGLRIRPSH
ncbi:ATP-dependent helicase [Propionibacteriaceae bacterium Y1685]